MTYFDISIAEVKKVGADRRLQDAGCGVWVVMVVVVVVVVMGVVVLAEEVV